jgi:hypothetical protein
MNALSDSEAQLNMVHSAPLMLQLFEMAWLSLQCNEIRQSTKSSEPDVLYSVDENMSY